ncbi:hypothetical protein L810_6653 [Burkholderia sp. AU4i]|nr:hypothetical protein L810_6653 [Burkholderia sp. AU4i]
MHFAALPRATQRNDSLAISPTVPFNGIFQKFLPFSRIRN